MASHKCDLPCDNINNENHQLTMDETEILEYSFGFPIRFLCHQHYLDQFSRYNGWHRKCSDPCSRHKKVVKTKLSEISLAVARSVKAHTEFNVVPGQSLCQKCDQYLTEVIREADKPLTEGPEDLEVGNTQRGFEAEDDSLTEDSPQ